MKYHKAQTALEYMLLLGTTMVIALVGFKVFLPSVQNSSDLYYKRVGYGVAGVGPRCGDSNCIYPENAQTCCVDCGTCSN